MSSHIAISTEQGQVYVAGPNTSGQLSLGTTTQTNTFSLAKTDATTNLSGVIQTAVGSAHSLFLRSSGAVYSSGSNTSGQLASGTTVDTSFAQIVLSSATTTLGNVVSVAAGASHSLFLLSDGSALVCGLNTSSQLGDGTTSQRSYPVNVLKSAGVFLDPVVSLAGGTSHSVFALTGGTTWACGLNTNNQLGDGTTTTRAYATQVKTGASTFLTGVTQVAAGDLHCLALTSSGTVFGWGRNNSGQLGLGTTVDAAYATQVLYGVGVSMTNIVAVAAHANHSLFLDASGTAYSCGLNGNGQLGDGTIVSRSYPVVVSTAAGVPLTDVVSIGTAGNQSYFIKADGRIYACGAGSGGGLGNGGVADLLYATLVLTSDLATVKSFGYSASYWKNQGTTASTLAAGGFTAYDLANAGYTKTELSGAGFTVANIAGAGAQKLYSLGYSHADIVNGTNTALSKIGQYTVGSGKLGTLMTGGLLDAPKSVSATGRDATSISVAIGAPIFSTGLTGYSVQAVPVSGGSTVTKSLGPAGTLVDGLATGKIYDLAVRSVSANGSSQATILRNSTSLSLPASLTEGTITENSIVVNFTALATQDCSYVLRTTPASNQYVLANGATTQTLSGLTQNTTYTIILEASNAFVSAVPVSRSSTTSASVIAGIAGNILWLDSTDSTSYTLSGSNVTQWNDKSPNAKHMTKRIGNGPTLSTINSKTIFDFTSTTFTDFENTTFSMPTSYTVFAVAYTPNTVSDYGRLLTASGGDYTSIFFFGRNGTNYTTFVGSGGNSWNDINANGPAQSVTSLKVLGLTNNNTNGGLIPYVNGTSQNTKNGSTIEFTGLLVGGGYPITGTPSQPWKGYIGEVVIYNSVLSTANRQSVENYLKTKWGIP